MCIDIKDEINKLIDQQTSGPFLFIGSGFSKRYLGLPSWKNLLEEFCTDLKPFNYYYASANSDLAKTASKMNQDFHESFFNLAKYEDVRKNHAKDLSQQDSALKIAICDYIEKTSSIDNCTDPTYLEEIDIFKKLNMDGYLTTNWDTLLEDIFPEYDVYIGQTDLLFSGAQSLSDIYKIHGCISKPNSLVLNSDDYERFESRDKYLAAKLMTIFIEHPVIFIGYSISDKNIENILENISYCIEEDHYTELAKNLIFVNWIQPENPEEEKIYRHSLLIKGRNIPITIVQLKNFIPLFSALSDVRPKIPAWLLKKIKNQVYEAVKGSEPRERIILVDANEIDDRDDVEFVIGFSNINDYLDAGTANHKTSYDSYSTYDIFHDYFFDDKNFDPEKILTITIPKLLKHSTYIPVKKYIAKLSKNKQRKILENQKIRKVCSFTEGKLQYDQYRRTYSKNYASTGFAEFCKNSNKEKIIAYAPFFTYETEDIKLLEKFLKENLDYFFNENQNYKSFYRKVVCLYDKLQYPISIE